MKIAIQGQTYSFHDQARKKLFPNSDPVCFDSFYDVFEAVKNGAADKGIVAIENNLYGSINEVYDLLVTSNTWVSGETYIHVSLSLLGLPGATLQDLESVHTHRVAFTECQKYLRTHVKQAEQINESDTAKAAELVLEWKDPKKAAVAAKEITETLDLVVLAENIDDEKRNYTRFLVIQADKIEDENSNKTSIVLRLPERPGVLYEALGLFAQREINLTKIESRPIPGTAWEYMFYLDFESATANALGLLDDLAVRGNTVTVLGSYPKADPLTAIAES